MRFSASRRALLEQCSLPFQKSIQEPEEQKSGVGYEASQLGKKIHDAIQKYLVHHDVNPILLKDEHYPYMESWVLFYEKWRKPWTAIHVEEAYALDIDDEVARPLAQAGHRDYSNALPTEVVGTLDFLARAPSGKWVLRDWKVDSPFNVHDRKDPKLQVNLLGTMVGLYFSLDEIDVGYVRIGKDECEERSWTLSLSSFYEECKKLRKLFEKEPRPETGLECVHCPIRTRCPAFSAIDLLTNDLIEENIYDEETVRQGYVHLRIWEEQVRTIRETMKLSLEKLGGKVNLSENRILTFETYEKETTSKSSILEAPLVSKKERVALLEKIREIGGMKTSLVTQMVERNVK